VRHSVLIVEIPAAESLVSSARWRYDRAARLGVPAHVTVLFPFAEPDAINSKMINELRTLFEQCAPFDFQLTHVARFDRDVLFLAPSPLEKFIELTNRVSQKFPEYPPYGGIYDEVIPHLTVAQGASVAEMDHLEDELTAKLPISSRAHEITLMAGDSESDGSWSVLARFVLGH
jgi:2'-5' RNA ligase